ncbi:nuclease [Rhizobium sp. AG855]|uniref:thermonuclease family protein n=1 Tax=Rhizobium sp. AG855 TaxID=2183898 RepID=UPI000E7546E5|nr:nuclease [Rhizobium sp. AG855]RKE84896.1 hypothetical protein DFO46_1671 [Rhizobium sp. AG855]
MSSRTASSRRAPAKRRKSSRSSSAGQGVTQWIVILALVAGGIALYDNRQTVMKQVAPLLKDDRPSVARTERKAEPHPEKSAAPVGVAKAPVPPVAVGAAKAPVPDAKPAAASASAGAGTALMGEDFKGRFYFCGTSGLDNCVADGDTFWFSKTRITLADISAPATDKAVCQQERDRGFAAKVRLRDLLNAGKFDIEVLKGQPLQAGSSVMRVVTRDGRSLGSILVSEGLAKPRLAANQSWCP